MKVSMLLYLTLFVNLLISAQTTKKFTYEQATDNSNAYYIRPKFEEPVDKIIHDKNKLELLPHIWLPSVNSEAHKLIERNLDSTVKSSLSAKKWDKLKKIETRGYYFINLSADGKMYSLCFYLNKKHLNVLTDDDLYAIYKNFEGLTIDMEKLESGKPKTYPDATNMNKYHYWKLTCPLTRQKE